MLTQSKSTGGARKKTCCVRQATAALLGMLLLVSAAPSLLLAESYTSTSATGAWNTARWNNTSDGSPYDSTFTSGNNVVFTAGDYSFAGMGASINVGNVTANSGVKVSFTSASNTFATGGNIRTFDVGSGALLDFGSQSFSTAAGTGFVKNGSGVLSLSGNDYSGGFTLNAGTVVARSVSAFGGSATNVLNLYGGVVASNATRDFSDKFGGGINIAGNVQFGELTSNVSIASSSANLTFSNSVSLGSATRTFTLGNQGTHTFSGAISNTGSGGIIFAANAGTSGGAFALTNTASTFTGDVVVNGGTLLVASDGSLGNAANDVSLTSGVTFGATSGSSPILNSARTLSIGSGIIFNTSGTSTSMTVNGSIQDLSGAGSITKNGLGTLVLAGTNTYSGNTAVTDGNLQVGKAGVGSIGSGSVSVQSGGALSGTGVVNGATNVQAGSVRPGDSGGSATGTLTTQSLTFTPASAYTVGQFQVQSDSSYDQLLVNGDLSLNGNSRFIVDGTGYSPVLGHMFTLIDWVGSLTLGGFNAGASRNGSGDTGTNLDLPDISSSGYYWQISDMMSEGALTITVVPEPSRALLLLVGVTGMVIRRRR